MLRDYRTIHGLINGFADEIGGIRLLQHLLVLKGVVPLRRVRTTGIKPAINDILHAMHRATAFFAREGNFVYIRTVKLNIIWHIGPEFLQFGDTTDTVLMPAVGTYPDRQGGTPITFTTQSPVDIVFQPIAETSIFDMLRIPVDFADCADASDLGWRSSG